MMFLRPILDSDWLYRRVLFLREFWRTTCAETCGWLYYSCLFCNPCNTQCLCLKLNLSPAASRVHYLQCAGLDGLVWVYLRSTRSHDDRVRRCHWPALKSSPITTSNPLVIEVKLLWHKLTLGPQVSRI